MTDFGLGRIPNPPDDRDGRWTMRAVLPPRFETRQTRAPVVHWKYGFTPLNQGQTGTCVGHAGEHFLLAEPVVRKQPGDQPDAYSLYRRACDLDGLPANDDHNLDYGTTIRALMLTLREAGLIEAWRNGEDMDDVLDWLDLRGPVIVGVDWFPSMFQPDGEGYVALSGTPTSGHAFILIGYDLTGPRPYVEALNSWGSTWGKGGKFRITLADLGTLLFTRRGDVAVADELPVAPEPVPPPAPEPEPAPKQLFGPYQRTVFMGHDPATDEFVWEFRAQRNTGDWYDPESR